MKTKLVWITPKAEDIIAYCARVSSPNQDNPEITNLLKYCIKNKHWSIFEMANMCIEITTTRAISAQILRHDFSFQEFSQRYAQVVSVEPTEIRKQDTKNRQNSLEDIDEKIKEKYEKLFSNHQKASLELYLEAINDGVAKECARMILPMSSTTKLYMNGTIRNWIHYLQTRLEPKTSQKEHKLIAEEILKIFKENLPIIYKAVFDVNKN